MGARRLRLLVRRQRPASLPCRRRPILVNVVLDGDATWRTRNVLCGQQITGRANCVNIVRPLTVLL